MTRRLAFAPQPVAWRTRRGLRGLGDCPPIAGVQAQYAAPGCSLSYNASPGMPCQVRAWCPAASTSKQFQTPSPSFTSGWDVHLLDAQAAVEAQSDAQWQLANGYPNLLPQTIAELQATGQPIPTPPQVVTAAGTPIGAAANPSTALATATSWLDGSTSIAGITIPNMGLAVGGGALLLLLLMRHKR